MIASEPARPVTPDARGAGLLYVGNFLSAGLNHGYCEELADRLAARGWAVTRTSTRRARAARLLDMLGTAWRRRARYAVATVDVFSGPAFVWAEATCFELRRLAKPYVLTLHGGNLPAFAARWPRRVRRLLGSAVLVTAPSRYLRDHLRAYRDDIAVVPNALDLAAYRFAPRARPAPRLVWVRAFHQIYDPVLAIEVLARLAPRFPAVQLTMIGPDKGDGTLAAVERRARELGVRDRLALPGRLARPEVAAQLAAADVFLNTTRIDNTPLSILEAAASGLCVVSTSVGGIPFLLRHDHDALLVPPGDPGAACAAVARVLDEPGLGERLSRAARDTAAACDWGPVLDRWEQVLVGAAGHG